MITLLLLLVAVGVIVGGLVTLIALVMEEAIAGLRQHRRWRDGNRQAAARQKALDRQWAREQRN